MGCIALTMSIREMARKQRLRYLAEELVEEAYNAANRYPPFNSAHEGFAVLQEEVDELWDEVKKSPKKREPEKMREEAIQTGAMALRFLFDCCTKEEK